jgi:PST family polysaccharide transporter
MLSNWFFIGLEKASYLNGINFFSKIFYVISIFFFIGNPSDFYLVPAFNSLSVLIAGFLSLYIVFKNFEVRFSIPSRIIIVYHLRNGWNIFFANFSMNLYRNANIVILGLLAPKEIVGIYGAGEKLIKGMQNLFVHITNSFYPYISHLKGVNPKKSIKAIKWLLILLGVITFIVSSSLFFFSDIIAKVVFGGEFSLSARVISIGSFVVFFSFFNYVLGIIFMINFRLEVEFRRSVMITGVLNIIFCYFLSYNFQEIGAAFSLLFAEVLLFFLITTSIYNNKNIIHL